jgi:GNAT superfamily N-acetyltransferase
MTPSSFCVGRSWKGWRWWRGDFELICVHPEVQRLGVATRLFAAIRNRLQPTQLEAHAPLPSVNWYLKHGFTIRAAPLVEGGVLWDIPLVWRAGFDR